MNAVMPAKAGIHDFLKTTQKTKRNQPLTTINQNPEHSTSMNYRLFLASSF